MAASVLLAAFLFDGATAVGGALLRREAEMSPVNLIPKGKTGDTRNDAETGRCYISQTFYAKDENGRVESFDHVFYLQSYSREEWLEAFKECGFEVVGEYKSREVESWQSGGDGFRIFEAVKNTSGANKYPPEIKETDAL